MTTGFIVFWATGALETPVDGVCGVSLINNFFNAPKNELCSIVLSVAIRKVLGPLVFLVNAFL